MRGFLKRFLRRKRPVRRRRLQSKLKTQAATDLCAVGPAVARFAANFPKNNPASFERMARSLLEFRRISLPFEVLERVYAKRSAEQILKSKTIFSIKKGDPLEKEFRVQGCVDRAIVLVALFTAKGIPARFVRIGGHSFAKFFWKKKWWKANPSDKEMAVKPLSPADAMLQRTMESAGLYAEGENPATIGLRSIFDMRKFAEE